MGKSLHNYVMRFNNETLKVDGNSHGIALTTITVELQDKKLLWSLRKKTPITFDEFISRAQRHMKAGGLLSAEKDNT